MLRALRLLVLAAAPGLLGTGCEFWSNLAGSKTVDRGDLDLVVRDAFTGEPLALSHCRDSADTWTVDAEGPGRVRRPGMATGRLALACSAPGYWTRSVTVDIRPGGRTDTVELGREGLGGWYKEDSLRVSLALEPLTGGLRFPGGSFRLKATPANRDGKLTYRWSTRRLGDPYLDDVSKEADLTVRSFSFAGDTLYDTIVVTVTAKLAGREYEVGADTVAATFLRNLKPTVKVTGTQPSPFKFCQEANPRFKFSLAIQDPDGKCAEARFYSRKQFSSLGDLDSLGACPGPKTQFMPLVAHEAFDTTAIEIENELWIDVKDDNGEKTTVMIPFVTYPNIPAKLEMARTAPAGPVRSGDSVRVKVTIADSDDAVGRAVIRWGDGDSTLYEPTGTDPRVELGFGHAYRSQGDYTVTAITSDCGDTAKATLPVSVAP